MTGPFRVWQASYGWVIQGHDDDDHNLCVIECQGNSKPLALAFAGALNSAPADQPLSETLKNLAERGHA